MKRFLGTRAGYHSKVRSADRKPKLRKVSAYGALRAFPFYPWCSPAVT